MALLMVVKEERNGDLEWPSSFYGFCIAQLFIEMFVIKSMVREMTLRTQGSLYFFSNVGIISALVCFFVGDVDDRDVLGVQNPKNVNGLECLHKIVL